MIAVADSPQSITARPLLSILGLPHNAGMKSRTIPVNRPLVGILALVCLAAALALTIFSREEELWRSAFMRVGLLLGAFWLALPTRQRPSAWANVSPTTLIVSLLALVMIARMRIPLKLVVPVLVVLVLAILILRPRKRDWPRSPLGRNPEERG